MTGNGEPFVGAIAGTLPPPRAAVVCRESRSGGPTVCPAAEVTAPAVRYLRRMPPQLARAVFLLRRHPTAADTLLAAILAAAALVSTYGTFELLRQDTSFHEPAKGWIVVTVVATALPLAL